MVMYIAIVIIVIILLSYLVTVRDGDGILYLIIDFIRLQVIRLRCRKLKGCKLIEYCLNYNLHIDKYDIKDISIDENESSRVIINVSNYSIANPLFRTDLIKKLCKEYVIETMRVMDNKLEFNSYVFIFDICSLNDKLFTYECWIDSEDIKSMHTHNLFRGSQNKECIELVNSLDMFL